MDTWRISLLLSEMDPTQETKTTDGRSALTVTISTKVCKDKKAAASNGLSIIIFFYH